MKLRGTLLVSLAVLVAIPIYAQGLDGTVHNKEQCVVPKDEIAAYSSFLSAENNSSALIVVTTDSQTSTADVDYLNLQLAVQGCAIPQDVRANFKSKDKSSCRISPFSGIKNFRFMSKAKDAKIFKVEWSEFHKKYGKDASSLQLSRVGFNSDKTLALVHVSGGIGPMAGGGTLCLLEQKADRWVVKTSIQTWTT